MTDPRVSYPESRPAQSLVAPSITRRAPHRRRPRALVVPRAHVVQAPAGGAFVASTRRVATSATPPGIGPVASLTATLPAISTSSSTPPVNGRGWPPAAIRRCRSCCSCRPLFVPDEEVAYCNDAGSELVDNAHRFVSRLAADRFLGYLQAQKAAMMGRAGAHTNRPELVAIHGYDTSARCTRFGLAVKASSCLRPAASRCRSRSPIADTSGRSGAARSRSTRSSLRYQQRKPRSST